jgi:hypothetical protein
MALLLTILITVFGIGIILYFLMLSNDKELEKMQKSRIKREEDFRGADPRKVYSKKWDPKIPRPRICPACGTALKKNEYLYASMGEEVEVGKKRQVHIYGCKYCYLGLMENEGEKLQDNFDI